jgi:hypothetical protein
MSISFLLLAFVTLSVNCSSSRIPSYQQVNLDSEFRIRLKNLTQSVGVLHPADPEIKLSRLHDLLSKFESFRSFSLGYDPLPVRFRLQIDEIWKQVIQLWTSVVNLDGLIGQADEYLSKRFLATEDLFNLAVRVSDIGPLSTEVLSGFLLSGTTAVQLSSVKYHRYQNAILEARALLEKDIDDFQDSLRVFISDCSSLSLPKFFSV